MKELLYAAPGEDRKRALVVDDERAAQLLADPAFELAADQGEDADVAPDPEPDPATVTAQTEPEADGGEGQANPEE